MKGQLSKGAAIDLGLEISRATLEPGERRTCTELSYYCSCTKQNISVIFQRGLRKCRLALYRDKHLQKELNEYLKTLHLR